MISWGDCSLTPCSTTLVRALNLDSQRLGIQTIFDSFFLERFRGILSLENAHISTWARISRQRSLKSTRTMVTLHSSKSGKRFCQRWMLCPTPSATPADFSVIIRLFRGGELPNWMRSYMKFPSRRSRCYYRRLSETSRTLSPRSLIRQAVSLGRVHTNPESFDDECEAEEREEDGIECLETGEDAAEAFQSPEESFDLVALLIQGTIILPGMQPVGLGRDYWNHAEIQHQLAGLIAFVSAIHQQRKSFRHGYQNFQKD